MEAGVFIIWWLIALAMAALFFILEWRLWRAGTEQVFGNQKVTLPGYRWQYLFAAYASGFIGFMGVYFGLLSFAGIESPSICWLIGSLLIGAINLFSVSSRLKYLDFFDQ
jgi:hypothetical protein